LEPLNRFAAKPRSGSPSRCEFDRNPNCAWGGRAPGVIDLGVCHWNDIAGFGGSFVWTSISKVGVLTLVASILFGTIWALGNQPRNDRHWKDYLAHTPHVGQTEFFLTDDDGFSHCFGIPSPA
jgi:hypothetical protein